MVLHVGVQVRLGQVAYGMAGEGLHHSFARHGPRDAVGTTARAGAIYFGENLVAVLHPLWPFSRACRYGFGLSLCQNCVSVARMLIGLSKSGCPAWTRTMSKSSKDSCATITPPDNTALS